MKEAKNKIIEFVTTKLLTDGMAWIDLDGTIRFGLNNPSANQYSENVRSFLHYPCGTAVLALLKKDPEMAEVMTMQCLQFSQSQLISRLGNMISSWKGEIIPIARAKVLASGVEKYPQRRPSKRDIRRQELKDTRERLMLFEQKLSPELQVELQDIMNKLNKFMKDI